MSGQFKCCGVGNYTDFSEAKKWDRTYDTEQGAVNLTVPIACCKLNGSFPDVTIPTDFSCAVSPTSANANIDQVSVGPGVGQHTHTRTRTRTHTHTHTHTLTHTHTHPHTHTHTHTYMNMKQVAVSMYKSIRRLGGRDTFLG